jgi:exosortase N
MIALPAKRSNKENGLLVLLLLIGVMGGASAFTPSYFSNLNVLIGLCLFPFALLIIGPKRNNVFYIGLMILFASLAVIYKIRICYFFSLAFYFLWLTELFFGRLNALILFLILFMSPFFIQVATILGFPLRLMLSEYAGELINLAGVNVQVEGNMMTLNGEMFSVDEACMGLNMLVISLLMGVFVLAYRYRVSNTTLDLYSTTLFFVVAFMLNMVTNVIRIIVLVFFGIPPENPMHEFIGVFCLVVYVVVPLHFFSAWLVQKYGKTKDDVVSSSVFNRGNMVCLAIVPIIILFAGTTLEKNLHYRSSTHADVRFGEVKPERLNDGISKISTNDLLIYVKTIPEFFTAEHTPLMCWKGSGYEFSGIATTSVEGITIYKGTLVKGGKSLHTAWWYSNGQVQTISQLDWRMRMLQGEANFCLVNVTAQDEQTLMTSITSMFTTKALSIKVDL